jgi:hypothetical protein
MDERISVRSVTGVDLTLNIAGPGSRSYAFAIDWHVRLLLGAAWLIVALYVLKLSLNARSQDALLSLLPAAIVYFLYHPILEVAMRGSTPGKRIAGIRIVDRSGGEQGGAADPQPVSLDRQSSGVLCRRPADLFPHRQPGPDRRHGRGYLAGD